MNNYNYWNYSWDFTLKKKLPLPSSKWYFAFGSNMSRRRMQKRGLIWECILTGRLKNWELNFNKQSFSEDIGYASISKKKGSTVEGLLYKLEDKDQAYLLDEFENAPNDYKRIEVFIKCGQGSIRAFTYIATKKMTQTGLNPTREYLDYLLDGKRYLSEGYFNRLTQVKTGSVFDNAPLNVFVYGTLKKGFGNHYNYCKNAVSVKPARIDGELYNTGLPYVHVDKSNIFSVGTRSKRKDYEKQDELAEALTAGETFTQIGMPFVQGELIEFKNWDVINDLDRLEGFSGSSNYNHYTRVLTSCYKDYDNSEHPCWVYVIDKKKMRFNEFDLANNGLYESNYNSQKDYLTDDYYYSAINQDYGDIPELFEDVEKDENEQDLVELFEKANF